MTRVQEMSMDYHFKVEQESGSTMHSFFGFNGNKIKKKYTSYLWGVSLRSYTNLGRTVEGNSDSDVFLVFWEYISNS
jgi:hypothetical protein